MSITYLIAFDKKLNKTNFLYRNILPSKKFVFSEDDGIKFEEKLFPQEQDIANKMFFGRCVYSIRSTLSLDCNENDIDNIAPVYYTVAKEQLEWFKSFLAKNIKPDQDVLFLKIALGHPINYSKILSQKVNVKNIEIGNNFDFTPELIYQFVND